MSAITLASPLARRRLPGNFGRLRWYWTTTVVWGEEFKAHPLECLCLMWQTRFGRNAILSVGAWLFMYGVFYVEVAHLGMSSRHAKLLWSPMGIPSGLMIQWFVFGDRVMTLKRNMSWRRLTAHLSWRLSATKLVFFFANQGAYIVALLVLPYLLAAPASASFMSVVYYLVTLRWITRVRKAETA